MEPIEEKAIFSPKRERKVVTKDLEHSTTVIYTTKDYDIFTNLRGQRKVDKNRVKRLANEMKQNDLHPYRS